MSVDGPWIDPTLTQPGPAPRDTSFQVPAYEVPEAQGFVDRTADSFGLQPSIQATHRLIEWMQPSEAGYDPLKDERFKGNEEWAPFLREARSSTEFGLMLERFRQNEQMRARSNANGTIWNELAAGLLDPANLLIPGGLGGRGLVRGALEGALLNGVSAIPLHAASVATDATAPKEGMLEEAFYSAVIGGVLGGVAGGLGSLGEYHPAVGRLAREFQQRQADLDSELSPVVGADGVTRLPVRMNQFEVRASDGNEGWAPTGLGLEHATGAGSIFNPLKTSVGWAVQSGVRAYQDLALMLGGDFGAKLKSNIAGEATPASAYLDAGKWRGVAAQTLSHLFQAYSEYLGKPNPMEVAGVGLSTQMARLGGLARKVTGRRRADGKMEFNEFLEAIVHAHRMDRIEPNLDRMSDKSAEAVAAVHKGAGIVRGFFDHADREGTGAGFFKEPWAEKMKRRFAIHDANEAEIRRLSDLGERTPIEDAELRYRSDVVRPRVMNRIPEREHLQRRYDQLMGQWKEGIEFGLKPTRKFTNPDGTERVIPGDAEMDQLHAQMRELEDKGIGQRRVGGAETASVSNPDTGVPAPEAAREQDNGAAPAPEAKPEVVLSDGEVKPIRPFDIDETRFNPPENDPGITVDYHANRDYNPDRLESADPVTHSQVQDVSDLLTDDNFNTMPPLPKESVDRIVSILNSNVHNSEKGSLILDLAVQGWGKAKVQQAHDLADLLLFHYGEIKTVEKLPLPHYETGRPVVADSFHGTTRAFTHFDTDKSGTGAGGGDTDGVIYSSRNPQTASTYAEQGSSSLWAPATPSAGGTVEEFAQALFAADMKKKHGDLDHSALAEEWEMLPDAEKISWLDDAKAKMSQTKPSAGQEAYFAAVDPDGVLDNETLMEDWNKLGAVDKAKWAAKGLAKGALDKVDELGFKITDGLGITTPPPAPAPNVVMSRVRIDNPLVWDNVNGEGWSAARNNRLIAEARAGGHDGIVLLNTRDGGPTDVIYITFSPDQMRFRFDPKQAEARAAAARAKGAIGVPDMPGLANDNTPGARPVEPPGRGFLHRDEAGLLEGHELIPANDNADRLGGPETDPHYLPRLWDTEKVRADADSLRAIFDRWHDDQGKARLSDDEWSSILKGILEEKRAPGDEPEINASPIGGFWRQSRKLDIPNEYVADFIENNAGELLMQYAHRLGPGLEVHKKFGERDAMDAIDAAVIQGIREGHGGDTVEALLAKAQEATKHFQDVRDMTLGDMHKDDPTTLTKVGVETAKAYTSTVLLGKVVFSQMVELARPLMTHGFMRNFQFISDNMIGNLSEFEKAGRELRQVTGEGFDTALGLAAQRYFDFGDLGRPGSSLANRTRGVFEPFMKFAHGPWYVMNLMGPVTDITKNYVQVMASHYLIEDLQKIAAGKASQRTIENIAALGIDMEAARRMVAEPVERSGKLNVANLSGWQDPALAQQFAAAVRGDVNRVINTPSPQTKSAISQGFLTHGDGRRQWAMVTLPFQFMSWGLSAAQKISMSALQGRDANALGGVAALIGTAYLTQWLKTDASSWDKTPVSERVYRAVDQSGALAFVGNLNSMVESVSMGHAGIRPMFNMDPGYGETDGTDAVGALGGPVGSRVSQAYKAFTDPDMDNYQRASVLRRAIPTNGLIYTDGLWKGLQKGAFALTGTDG